MPPRGADPADKRSSPLRSHPPALPLAKRPEEHQKPSEVESGAELLGRFPFRCSSPINFKGLRTSDAEDTASDSDKNNSAFGLKRQVYSNSDVLDETVHSSMSESPEFESKLVAPIDQGKWDLPNSSLAEESKDEAKPLVGLGILGLESKDMSFPEESLHMIQSQEETEESLTSLINELIAEEGNDIVPDTLVALPEKDTPYPSLLMETDYHEGLTDEQVADRRKAHGRNCLTQNTTNNWIKFLSFFVGPIQFVMEAVTVLAAGLRSWIDFGIICALLLLNAIVGFVQEYHAGNIVANLRKTLALRALVVRNSDIVEIQAEDVVIGDIVYLEDGSIVAADGSIIATNEIIQVDQSGITGESLAVEKAKGDTCYASSAIKRGSGYMVVTAIGDHTYVGTAAALVQQAQQSPGHFTLVLNGMARSLLYLVIFTLVAVWISGFYRSNLIIQILEHTLAIAMVGVPVGLPIVVTTTMAVGAAYLANRKAIVQKLSAIESLAGVEILCSDKTGTLTRNVLTLGEQHLVPGNTAADLMLIACLAANRKKGGIDAIDKVFLKGLRHYPAVKAQIASYKTLEFSPFDSVSKRVTALVQSPDGERITCIKGAPRTVLQTVLKETVLSEQFVAQYKTKVLEFATRGFRCLGIARKREGHDWEIMGIMPVHDPPRHDTAQTIVEAKSLGLSIKMLTGDAVGIARETSARLGLGTNIYNAERLGVTGAGCMPGSEVADFVEAADGFAEVFPQHKYSVIEILQARGYLVAMTGDGVNDAPSLKKADTGIAVEGASDAARSAADIVFLAPGLSAIIDSIKTSRQIFHRMYSYVVYRIALSIHLEIFFGIKIFIENETLDLRLIVLFAIFADIATLAIAYDNAPYSHVPVKWNTPRLWGESIVLGSLLAIGSWVAYTTTLLDEGGIAAVNGFVSQRLRDEVMFLEISLTQSWLIFVTRSSGAGSRSLWTNKPSMSLCAAIVAIDVTATLIACFGIFGSMVHPLTALNVWVIASGVTCAIAMAYILLHNSPTFDNLMHGRLPRRKAKPRSSEDFGLNMQRMANQHEATT
ncbi:uncharacterized protein N7506_004743 [Penicillium brevicompactum]|uniref:uncharacterized protein n=1 Tax=Penicillium brevicompactum TaxID=5074 RepID=UPI002540A879|nr:uncharacterized protein N7506_004743 [Penicillium brevicompactum]KAJ5336721.1 hypothetical protein N7506_004743 [Penicillium brevicompactum]